MDGKRQIQIPNKWTLMSGCSQPEVCCRKCTLAMNGLDTKSGNKRLQAANQTKGHSFLGSCFPMNPGRQTRDKVHKTQLTSQPTCPFVPTTGQKVPTCYILSRLGRTSFLLRASPMVLPMWSCTATLDEETLTFAGLAQENGFGPSKLRMLPWLVKGEAALCTCRK